MSFRETNFLENNRFLLVIPSFESTRFFSQSFELPSLALPSATAESPFSRMALAGDKVGFNPITFEFIVDENMTNYQEIFEWIMNIGYVKSFDDFENYRLKTRQQPLGEQDIKIVLLDSKNQPMKTFTFMNAIPISLSGSSISTQVNETQYVRASVTFDFDYFDIE